METYRDRTDCISYEMGDFTSDVENNIVHVSNPNGTKVAINTWTYALYFYENIQRKEISDHWYYLDGIRFDKFVELFLEEKHATRLSEFIQDKITRQLYWEMFELHGTHVNWVALYGLCSYIREIINRRYAVLLKPTLADTLAEIGTKENLREIRFELENGGSHVTDFYVVRDIVLEALRAGNVPSYGFHKIVRKVDVYTHEYGEIEFVRYISRFLHEYFHMVKRHKNSYLTVTEQKIVCFLLKYFGFTPEVVQESRYRQLFNSKYDAIDHIMSFNIPGYLKSNVKLYLEYIPYTIWSKGKINPLNEKILHGDALEEQFTIDMGENPDITELYDYIKGVVG